jgi:hypothetical protein
MASRIVALLLMMSGTARADGELQHDFYNASCPGVEELVRSELKAKFAADITLPAGGAAPSALPRLLRARLRRVHHAQVAQRHDGAGLSTLLGHRGHQGQLVVSCARRHHHNYKGSLETCTVASRRWVQCTS